MSDLTVEQRIAEALAAEAIAEANCECLCHAEDWCGSCGHSFEGRVLPAVTQGWELCPAGHPMPVESPSPCIGCDGTGWRLAGEGT